MTYLNVVASMGQGHILAYNLKTNILGGSKFGNFCEFNTVDSKN